MRRFCDNLQSVIIRKGRMSQWPPGRVPTCFINPLRPTVAMGTAIKHPVPDRVKPSFVIFDIRAL